MLGKLPNNIDEEKRKIEVCKNETIELKVVWDNLVIIAKENSNAETPSAEKVSKLVREHLEKCI